MDKRPERRRHGRVRPSKPFPGHIRPKQLVAIVDLSRSGALLETVARLAPGQRCRLLVELSNRQLDLPIEIVRSHVHRIEALKDGESQIHYRAGVRFERLEVQDLNAIVQFLAQHAEAPATLLPETAPPCEPDSGEPDSTRVTPLPEAPPVGAPPVGLQPTGGPQVGLRFRRRGAPRVHTAGLHGELHLVCEGRVTSVSEGGIAVALPSPIEQGKAIAVTVELPGQPLKATGTVRYCRPLITKEFLKEEFEVGIAFDPLNLEQLEILRKLMLGGRV
jgi:hypothetical protein